MGLAFAADSPRADANAVHVEHAASTSPRWIVPQTVSKRAASPHRGSACANDLARTADPTSAAAQAGYSAQLAIREGSHVV